MKILVTYATRYGSTREYAQWIAADLAADLRPQGDVRSAEIAPYDVIVVGGYLRMGRIIGADFFARHRDVLAGKRLVLFSVAGAPERSPERTAWFQASVPADMHEAVRHFPLRGRAKGLNWWDRFLMSFPKMMLRIQYRRDPSESNRRALSSMDEFDAVSRDSIAPLVSAVRSL